MHCVSRGLCVRLGVSRKFRLTNHQRCVSSQSSLEDPPLKGIRILDLTRIVAGPYCTMILGDLGAEVFKIETPNGGDECRKWGPPFVAGTNESCYFVCLNRNKKSVCINLKSDGGKQIIYDLAQKCDVLIENYIPGKLSEMKLGYEHLKVIAPKLIYCSITGYGSKGPYRNKPGYDVIAASIGGLLNITGPKDGEPAKVGVAVTDIATGLYAHGAIMAALIKRSRTNTGQKIDCNLLSTQLASLINIGSNYLIAGKEAQRWGTSHESIVPYEAFPTKDGYFTIGTGSDKQFQNLCHKIDASHILRHKKFCTNKDRVQNRHELIEMLRMIFLEKTNKEWSAIFEDALFPCGPVNNLSEAFNDPHVVQTQMIKTVDHPTAGPMKLVGPAVEYSQGGNAIRLPPPTLGQHTQEILRNILKYDKNLIEELRNKHVIN